MAANCVLVIAANCPDVKPSALSVDRAAICVAVSATMSAVSMAAICVELRPVFADSTRYICAAVNPVMLLVVRSETKLRPAIPEALMAPIWLALSTEMSLPKPAICVEVICASWPIVKPLMLLVVNAAS